MQHNERFENLVQIQRPERLNQIIVVPIRIVEAPDITVVEIDCKKTNTLGILSVRDRQHTEMQLVGVVGDNIVAEVLDACRRSIELELTAEVVLDNGGYLLRFVSAKRIASALQLVGATELEIREAEAQAESCREGVLEYIRGALVELLGIKLLDSIPILKKALTTVILQAVSVGKIGGTPGRLHSLLVGPPAVGKGVVHRAAAILGPVHERISANSVTPAGLIGWTENAGKRRTRVHPGALVLSSGGVTLLEDAQHVDTHSHRHTFGILSDMLEAGRLIRTTYGQIDVAVETALLMDLNPRSTVRPASMNREILLLQDVGLPVNLLSRMDVVFMFERDAQRQQQLVLEMLAGISQVGPEEEMASNPKVRQLRVLVAFLRDRCPTVQLGAVTQSIIDRVAQLFDQNKEKLGTLDLASDFAARSGKSIVKFVAAAARLRSDCTANEADVALAFDIFEEKMRFLSMIEPSFEHVENWKHSPADKVKRGLRIVEHFSGQLVNINDVCSMFPNLTGKTVTRDLHHLGATSMGNGMWLIPSAGALKIPA